MLLGFFSAYELKHLCNAVICRITPESLADYEGWVTECRLCRNPACADFARDLPYSFLNFREFKTVFFGLKFPKIGNIFSV